METMTLWNKVKRPPAEVLKQIRGGRLSGMTDIKPQWRYQILTEIFGACGDGWYYDIVKKWSEDGADGAMFAFADINFFYKKTDGEWSKPVPGTGGSMLVAKESAGLHNSDEGYKMAVTDALSTAMKLLGVAADVYAGKWDGTKYRDKAKPPQNSHTESQSPQSPQKGSYKSNKPLTGDATDKQMGAIANIGKAKGLSEEDIQAFVDWFKKGEATTKAEASNMITGFDEHFKEWQGQNPEPDGPPQDDIPFP